MSNFSISTDIYDIASAVEEVKQLFVDESEDTLAADIYGYIGAVETRKIQSTLLVASELSNEIFAQRAKFKRNLVSHAINIDIGDKINAKPARIKVMLGLLYDDIIDNLTNKSFVIDRNCPITVGSKIFHVTYDVVLKQSTISDDSFSAIYDIVHEDPNANITTPYLPSPVTRVIQNKKYVFLTCQLSQMVYDTKYTTVVNSNIIENKITSFEFTDQLAYFEVFIGDYYITPVFEGSSVPYGVELYCYYTYIGDNTIRVMFDRTSYMPKINDEIIIKLYTTSGKSGNFPYKTSNLTFGIINSDTYGYSNVDYALQGLTDSLYGENMKSKDELRALLPKENLAKGSITTISDLNNYFNMVNTESTLLKAMKKIDNQSERTFYTYFVMKNSDGNVIPTNTMPLYVDLADLTIQSLTDTDRLTLPTGTVLGYDKINERMYVYGTSGTVGTTTDTGSGTTVDDDSDYDLYSSSYGNLNNPANFVYVSPFTIVINKSPMYMQYFLTKINQDHYVNFKFINLNAAMSYIATTTHWERLFYTNNNVYTLSVNLTQNIDTDLGITSMTQLIPDSATEEPTFESVNLYRQYMNATYWNNLSEDDLDFKTCYKLYYLSTINLNTNFTGVAANVPQNDSGYLTALTDAGLPAETRDMSYWVYTAVKSSQGFYYPCRIGNVKTHVTVNTVTSSTHTVTKTTTTKAANVVTVKTYDSANALVATVTYTSSIASYTHSPVITDFLNVMQNNYFLSAVKVDAIDYLQVTGVNKLNSLFFSNVVEAVNALYRTGTYYVYSKVDGDLFSIGTIAIDSQGSYMTYTWSSTSYNTLQGVYNKYNTYQLSSTSYNVSNVENDLQLKWYTSLKAGIADAKLATGTYHAYTMDKNNNPVYISKLYVTELDNSALGNDLVTDEFYVANVAYSYTVNLTEYVYDNYFSTYHLSSLKVKDNLALSEYSPSVYRAIMFNQYASGTYYVYTRDTDTTYPVLIGTVKITTAANGAGVYSAYYEWETQETYKIINNMKVFALFYRDGNPYRWEELMLDNADSDVDNMSFTYDVQMQTNDLLDVTNNIRINDSYLVKSTERDYGYFNPNTTVDLYVFAKFKDTSGNVVEYPYLGGLNSTYTGITPSTYFTADMVSGYSLCNIYTINDGVDFYEDYANTMHSVITPVESESVEGKTVGYTVSSVPVLSYRYSKDEASITEFIDAMELRKAYIDDVLVKLENTIGVDFKFFNTFGPSKTFSIDTKGTRVDRVNLSFSFNLKLSSSNDSAVTDYIKADVKSYIENLNYIDSEHISILITQINTDYAESIDYFDFIGFNDYGSSVLHLYKDADEDIAVTTAPEFLNIHLIYDETSEEYTPDITINLISE